MMQQVTVSAEARRGASPTIQSGRCSTENGRCRRFLGLSLSATLTLVVALGSVLPAVKAEDKKEAKKKVEVRMIASDSKRDRTSPFALVSMEADGQLRDEKSRIMTENQVRGLVTIGKNDKTLTKICLILTVQNPDMPIWKLTKQLETICQFADPRLEVLIEVVVSK